MSRKQLVELTRRNLAHSKAGTVDQAPDVKRVPASNYYDEDRWRLEMDRIFKRVPLTLAFSAEFREPGAYRAMEIAGVPILLTRGSDGELRGFLNACSHRGAIIVPEGSGQAKRFSCPYHGWIYDQKGALRSVLDDAEFGNLDKSCWGLTPLPVFERAGLVFGSLDPKSDLDIDSFLCGYDEMLAHLKLDECFLVGRQQVEGPNWKVAYDGYLDFYHLPILHKESFGAGMPNKALYDAWGPHQRVNMPMPEPEKIEAMAEEDWPIELMATGIWTIFPHISIALFDADGPFFMVSQLSPGDTPGTSVTIQNFLTRTEPDAERQEKIDAQMKFLEHVVKNEDYYTGLRVQRTLETGLKPEVLFGRNEGGGQRFHSWVDALIQADDSELPSLLASKVGPEVK
jgi:phenylpropionate dioxygenase-like ring-hydroxylating dioxygenase large terminal subunit